MVPRNAQTHWLITSSCLLLLHVTCPAWGFQGFCSTPRQVERPLSGTLTVITVEGKRTWWGLTPAIRYLTQKWHMSLPLMSWWPELFIWSYPTAERPGNTVPPGTQKEEPEIIDELHQRQHIHQDHTLLKTLPSSLSQQVQVWAPGQSTWDAPSVAPTCSTSLISTAPHMPPVSQDPEGCPSLCLEPILFPSPDLSTNSLMKTWGK